MAKIALILLDLTAKEQAEVLKKYGSKGKVAETDDEDDDAGDDEEDEDEDDAPAKGKKGKTRKGKPADDEDDEDDDAGDDEDDDDDGEDDEDDDGPTLAQVVAAFRSYAKKKGMPAAKTMLKSFKVKNVNDLDEKLYPKVLAKLKGK